MANLIKINVDEVVFEYSDFVWRELTRESAVKCVELLSSGLGVISMNDQTLKNDIERLMKNSVVFLPRVRMDKDPGYRLANAKWYRSLQKKKKELKSDVVFLSDAVNEILARPYVNEIARLIESVKMEMTLKRKKQELSPDQQAKLENVNKQIAQQRKLMRQQPKCTNVILSTLLHEVVDHMTLDDASALTKLKADIARQKKLVGEIEDKLQAKDVQLTDDERKKLQENFDNQIDTLGSMETDRESIMANYFSKFRRSMTPEAIAREIQKYPATSWDLLNTEKNMIEVSLRVAAGKRFKKQQTIIEQAESLLLFPLKLTSKESTSSLRTSVNSDLRVLEEWNRWATAQQTRFFDEEYKKTYEAYRNRLSTMPKEKGQKKAAQVAESKHDNEVQRNHAELLAYLKNIAQRIDYLEKNLTESSNLECIQKFASRNDFSQVFNKLKINTTEGRYVQAKTVMQYIRNVVKYNILEWGVPAPGNR